MANKLKMIKFSAYSAMLILAVVIGITSTHNHKHNIAKEGTYLNQEFSTQTKLLS